MWDWQRLFFLVFSFITLGCSLIITAIRREKNNSSIERIFVMHIFLFYISCVIAFTLLPLFDFIRDNSEFSINLIPFRTLIDFFKYGNYNLESFKLLLLNLLGNIAIFIPMGTFACMLNPKLANFKCISIVGFFSSIIIELFQLLEMQLQIVGYRASDIDDLIMNIIGCIAGFFIFRIISKTKYRVVNSFLRKVENKKNIL